MIIIIFIIKTIKNKHEKLNRLLFKNNFKLLKEYFKNDNVNDKFSQKQVDEV